ncbi:MAG: tetratricopeptide repeat protein [candidate division Zixibacteria bacterium]|nr:tetratricopeptide repeat protein [candidate division Zixibacteria bacterium]
MADIDSNFQQANQLFQDKEYAQAISSYQNILDKGTESAPLYFNLGNAYFKDGDLGRAILYYLKAQRLDPSDNDITANLEFARQFTSIQMEGVKLNPISTFFESLVGPYRLNTLAWLSSFFFILFFILLSLRYGFGFKNGPLRVGTTVVLILLLVSSWMTSFKYRHDYLTQRAVIVAEECPVYSGPYEQSDIELEAAPGLVVEILAESGEYYNVLFENKRRGWIKKDLIAAI